MPNPCRRRRLKICWADVFCGNGVRGCEIVALVKSYVVKVADARVSFPIPADHIAGLKLIERRNLNGITWINQARGDQPGRARFAVGGRSAAWDAYTAAAHERPISNAIGYKMSAIIANSTIYARSRRNWDK